MTDIGFGLLDRRTVITVLFTLVLMQLLFGLKIPVEIGNVVQLFIDLVVLTGYIYLARTIYRLPVAITASTITSAKNTRELLETLVEGIKETKKELGEENSKRLEKYIRISFLHLWLLLTPFFFIILLFIGILTFGEAIEKKYGTDFLYVRYIHYNRVKFLDIVFGILDRIGVVVIAAIATIPSFESYVRIIGVGGIILMIVLFTLRGDFTALLKDILEKKKSEKDEDEDEDEDEEQSNSSIEVQSSLKSPLYVEIVNSEDRPITVTNKRDEPLYIDHPGSKTAYPIPVSIEASNLNNYNSLPVYVTNKVETSVDSVLPVQVEIVHDVIIKTDSSLPVEITNNKKAPIPVEVTNVVSVENKNEEDDF